MSLSLPVVAIADLASPAELFRCDFYKTTLSAGSCIARQGVRRTFRGGTHGKYFEKEIVPKLYEYCASKKCEQGTAVRARLPDFVPPDKAEQVKRARRAAGAANPHQIEQQIAAKVASGELRPKDGGAEFIKRLPRAPDVSLPELDEEEVPVADKVCKTQDCTKPLRSDNESGYCTRHLNAHRGREARAALAKQRPAPPPTPALPVVLPGLLQAQPDSIESLLEQRRAHHLAEAERCGLALKALRGAA